MVYTLLPKTSGSICTLPLDKDSDSTIYLCSLVIFAALFVRQVVTVYLMTLMDVQIRIPCQIVGQ